MFYAIFVPKSFYYSHFSEEHTEDPQYVADSLLCLGGDRHLPTEELVHEM
jgi:hypothetical protein